MPHGTFVDPRVKPGDDESEQVRTPSFMRYRAPRTLGEGARVPLFVIARLDRAI